MQSRSTLVKDSTHQKQLFERKQRNEMQVFTSQYRPGQKVYGTHLQLIAEPTGALWIQVQPQESRLWFFCYLSLKCHSEKQGKDFCKFCTFTSGMTRFGHCATRRGTEKHAVTCVAESISGGEGAGWLVQGLGGREAAPPLCWSCGLPGGCCPSGFPCGHESSW